MIAGVFSRRTAVAFAVLATLSLGGCGHSGQASTTPEPAAAAPDSASADIPARRPIMLHARIIYSGASAWKVADNASGSRIAIEMMQPAFRIGEGANATYEVDNDRPTLVVGSVHGFGHAHTGSDAGELTEHYDEWARWPKPAAPAQGLFGIGMPRPSDIGDGLAVDLEMFAAVEGTRTAHVQSKDVSADVEPSVSVPVICTSSSDYRHDRGDVCGFKVSLDTTPMAASSEVGKQLLPSVQQGLAAPNGEWTMAGMGQLYGATTRYRERGHFVLTYRRDLAFANNDATMSDGYQIVVWSTDRNEEWTPAELPPLDGK